jgi:hypothetical protein
MRLWASVSSLTFDELVPRRGERVEVALSLTIAYMGPAGVGEVHGGFPINLARLGDRRLVTVPELGRTMVAVTGILRGGGSDPGWRIESRVSLRLRRSTEREGIPYGKAGDCCEALGSLGLSAREFSSSELRYPVLLHGFRSLCLRSDDPRFGQWSDVDRYGDLGSDPDVVGAPVCLAEIELEE